MTTTMHKGSALTDELLQRISDRTDASSIFGEPVEREGTHDPRHEGEVPFRLRRR